MSQRGVKFCQRKTSRIFVDLDLDKTLIIRDLSAGTFGERRLSTVMSSGIVWAHTRQSCSTAMGVVMVHGLVLSSIIIGGHR